MATKSMDQFSHTVADIMATMKELSSMPTPITGYEAIMRWDEAMSAIRTRLDNLYDLVLKMDMYREVAPVLRTLERHFDQLPDAPSIIAILRAHNLLLFHPCMLVIEEAQQSKLALSAMKHISLIDDHGDVLFDQAFVASLQQAEQPIHTQLTAQPSDGPTWQHIWTNLLEAVTGRFILAYDLAQAQQLLEQIAENFGFPLPILIGESFIRLVMEYIGLDMIAGKPGAIMEANV